MPVAGSDCPKVQCGGHEADSCADCPMGHPPPMSDFCGGDCEWRNEACQEKDTGYDPLFGPYDADLDGPGIAWVHDEEQRPVALLKLRHLFQDPPKRRHLRCHPSTGAVLRRSRRAL